MHLPRTFQALRHHNFRLYWFGQMVSLIGTWMQTVAQGWLVYELTGSPLFLGAVGFASSLPVLLFSLIAGVVADRVPRRRLILITQTLAASQALLLAVLVMTDRVHVWHIVALAFTLGTINAFDMPARQSFLLEMIPKEDLTNAVALNSTVFNLARVLGPAIAGLALATLGASICFLLNALSFLATIGSLLWMRLQPREAERRSSSALADLREGLAYVRQESTIRTLLLMVAVTGAFGLSYISLMPLFADKILGVSAQGYGWLMAAIGSGALLGSVVIASLGNFQHKGRLLTLGNIGFPLLLIVFSQVRSFPIALVVLAIAGSLLMIQGTMTNTLLQSTVPDALRGRIMSLYTMLFLGMTPLSNLLGGSIANLFSAPLAVALGGSVCLLTGLWVFWRYPRVRQLK